jgi:membrane-associated phospholipid phosphatase
VALALPTSSGQPVASERSLRAIDWLLLGYLGIVSVVAAVRAPVQPDCWWLLLAHALFGVFLLLLTRQRSGRVGRMFRELYPIFLLPGLYSELDVLTSGSTPVHDLLIQQWELLVFGTQVSREWWQWGPSRFWSTVLHAAYLSYYFIISAPAFFFAWRGDLLAVRRFVFLVMLTFVLCYLVFIFFPVAGPYYTFPRPADWFTDNWAARLVYQALETGSSYGAAFPSSHVAAAVVATLSAARVSRKLGLFLLVPTILLTIGVVYCQMHYGVDALTGLLVGVLVVAVSWRKLEKRRA